MLYACCSTGYGGAGRVQCDARTVHAQGRRVPACIQRDRLAVLRERAPLPHADLAREGPRFVPDAVSRQQSGPGPREGRIGGGGPRPSPKHRRALHRDQRQGAAAQYRPRLPRGTSACSDLSEHVRTRLNTCLSAAGAHHPAAPGAGGQAAAAPAPRPLRAALNPGGVHRNGTRFK